MSVMSHERQADRQTDRQADRQTDRPGKQKGFPKHDLLVNDQSPIRVPSHLGANGVTAACRVWPPLLLTHCLASLYRQRATSSTSSSCRCMVLSDDRGSYIFKVCFLRHGVSDYITETEQP